MTVKEGRGSTPALFEWNNFYFMTKVLGEEKVSSGHMG